MDLLTLRHVEDGGYESLRQCRSVSFIPKRLCHPDTVNPRDELIAFGCVGDRQEVTDAVDEHGVCRYGNGIVYVMNAAGNTVSKYRLNPEPLAKAA